MKYCIIIISLLLVYSTNVFAQKEIQYHLYDSSYVFADTSRISEAPVYLNYAEVQSKLEWPYQVDAVGYVYAACLIDTCGNIDSLTELKGVEVFFDEVKRVIYMLKFTPGKINSKPIKYYGIVPFRFIIR